MQSVRVGFETSVVRPIGLSVRWFGREKPWSDSRDLTTLVRSDMVLSCLTPVVRFSRTCRVVKTGQAAPRSRVIRNWSLETDALALP